MTASAKRERVFIVLLAISILAGWRPLAETVALAVRDSNCTYILLIIPACGFLIFHDWRALWESSRWGRAPGAVLLALALFVATFGVLRSGAIASSVNLSIRMLALVLFWIGSLVLCAGLKALRSRTIPLLLLLGMVPLPASGLASLIAQLQAGSAWSAHGLFWVFGVPVVQKGFLLTVPGLTLQVAQECSSIRSSSMLLVTSIILAQIVLRSTGRRLLVILLAVPLSVAKNGLRIFTIAMLGTRVDPGFLEGRLHRQGGILFFLLALLGLFATLAILHRGEEDGADGRFDLGGMAAVND